MNRKITQMSILLALGLVLNLSVQMFSLQGMKIDFVVVMLCISILNSESYEEVIMAGVAYGLLTALTTTFPNGQLANIIDKLVVSLVMYNVKNILKVNYNNKLLLIIFSLSATLLSGFIFLFTALYMSQTLNMFYILFFSIVIPSAIGNSIMITILAQVFKNKLVLKVSK